MPIAIFSFISQANIKSDRIADEFFELIQSRLRGASLGRFGLTEPFKLTFKKDRAKANTLWKEDLFWEEKAKKAFGSVSHGNRNVLSDIRFHFDFSLDEPVDFADFAATASTLLNVEYSSLHCIDKTSQTPEDEILEFPTIAQLRKCLPSIPWIIGFGRSYTSILGPEKIRTAPFVRVSSLKQDLYLCQLTEFPSDYWVAYDAFRTQQEKVKEHFGREFFIGHDFPRGPLF